MNNKSLLETIDRNNKILILLGKHISMKEASQASNRANHPDICPAVIKLLVRKTECTKRFSLVPGGW
jgi:hypothetical protein